MEPNPLAVNGMVVADLRSMLQSGSRGLNVVPSLVKEIIVGDMWRERVEPGTGHVVPFDSFAAFVATAPLEGLGGDVAMLRRICADDPEALRLLHEVTAQAQGERTDLHSNRSEVDADRHQGTTRAYTVARLATERPDLYERVKSGDMSAHAAAIVAGFRRPSMTVPTDVPGLARALRRRLSTDDLATLIVALKEQGCVHGSSSQGTSAT
jgi:hypothetical protein